MILPYVICHVFIGYETALPLTEKAKEENVIDRYMKNTTSAVAYLINIPSLISDDELLVIEHFTVSTDMIIKSQLLELFALNSRMLESTVCCTGIALTLRWTKFNYRKKNILKNTTISKPGNV